MNELDKMKAGMWYDANYDKDLLEKRMKIMDLCFKYNQTMPSHIETKQTILKQILGYLPQNVTILSPFACDYGMNLHLGKDVFVNCNSYFMDCADITIGDHVFIGPNCGFYTAIHSFDKEMRNQGMEKALPITIGSDVWIGGNVVILPGVHVGDNCIIGAGSVVTKDVPSGYVAYGNPCKIQYKVEDKD